MLDVFAEFAEVSGPIRVDLLAMLVANAVVEVPNQLGALMSEVAPIPCDLTARKLSCVLVSIIEVHQTFACHHSLFEVSLVHSTLVM